MLPKVKELPRPTFPLVGLFLFTALPFYSGTDHCPRWHLFVTGKRPLPYPVQPRGWTTRLSKF